jgi:replicative DNA helicase
MPDVQPLYNAEAEAALIGYGLIHTDDILAIDARPEWFYDQRNRALWQAMVGLAQQGIDPDLIQITNELERVDQLATMGGAAYPTRLMTEYPFNFNPAEGARIIREMAQRRSLIQVASTMARAAYDLTVEVGAEASKYIDAISRLSQGSGAAVHWSKYIRELYDETVERMRNPTDEYGIPTKFADFDRVTGGLQRGELFVLSGKPGVGKSILAMQMAAQMAETCPGAIYSCEMTGRQVVRRTLSASSGISAKALKTGSVHQSQEPDLAHAIERMSALPVYMSDGVGWTTNALRADLARLKAAHGCQWFVFDYLMLAGDAPGADEIERTAIISRNMKLICRHLDVAGIVVHSMNKAGVSTATPDQGNLRGSAQVIYDADLICFLTEFQPIAVGDNAISKLDQANMRTLFFAKGRELEDPAKYLHLVKRPQFPAFGNYLPR